MNLEPVAPAVVAVLAGLAGGWLWRRLPPRTAIVLLTTFIVAAAAAVVWALALLVIGAAIGAPALSGFSWCRRLLAVGHQFPPAVGVIAAVTLGVGIVRVVRFERRWRHVVKCHRGSDGVDVVDTDEIVAFAVPGGAGTVVVSNGLLALLSPKEQAAVLAHEACHLDRRHDRFIRVAGIAAAMVPILGRLADRVRGATEREADEAAAAVVSDRRVVARAIVAAATGSAALTPRLGMGDHAVAARLEELLKPPPPPRSASAAVAFGASATLLVGASSSTQLHHLVKFAQHICGVG